MPLNHYFFLIASLLYFHAASAQPKNYYLTGTIGKYPVYFNIECSGIKDGCFATYYYKRKKQDIDLDCEINKEMGFVLESSLYEEKISLEKSGTTWTGKWSNQSRSLDVNLTEFDPTKLPHKFGHLAVVKQMKKEDPWAYLRSSDLVLKEDSISFIKAESWFGILMVFHPLAFLPWTAPVSGLTLKPLTIG